MKINNSFLENLENDIRLGNAPSLDTLVNSISAKEIPRPLLAKYANLIKRIGGTKYALKLLNSVVRHGLANPNVMEITEYASCLTRLGLARESITLLEKIRNEPYSEVSYELASAYVNNWDYHRAIPLFEKYIQFPQLPPYKVYVGELNLIASLIYTNQLGKAKPMLTKLFKKIENQGHELLRVNILELMGDVALLEKRFVHAEAYFVQAQKSLVSVNPRYQFYLEKGLVICKMLKEKGSPKSLAEWEKVRHKLAKIGDWNSLREIEMQRALCTRDKEAITKLYYGVPYAGYRERLLTLWGRKLKIYKVYDRKIGPGPTERKRTFDISKGKDLLSGHQLKVGKSLHRLIQVLASDFYAPFSMTKIFSLVYDGSAFNPNTSPELVYEIVRRLNVWFTQKNIPLLVERGHGGYRLRARKSYVLRLKTNLTIQTPLDEFLDQLKGKGLIESFTAKEVQDGLAMPRRSVTRLLGDGIAKGFIVRSGRLQTTRYSINKKSR